MKDREIKMGVLYVMAHLIITLTIVVGYIIALMNGHHDETLKMALIAIIGYWFGALGKDSIREAGRKMKGDKNE